MAGFLYSQVALDFMPQDFTVIFIKPLGVERRLRKKCVFTPMEYDFQKELFLR